MGEVPRSITDRGRASAPVSARSQPSAGRTLLLIAPPGSISASLIAAVECEFDWLTARHASQVETACGDYDPDVELILVDQQLLEHFLRHGSDIKRKCPLAPTAVMANPRLPTSGVLIQVIETHAICGVLPMDVSLDVWLSILRILLKGGEYFPPRLLQRSGATTGIHAEPLSLVPVYQSETGSVAMDGLTEREREILERVARGNQNKIIAADLGLSEHTVKIHLHNIIRKLGVHNRTEAAAIYHAQERPQAAAAHPANSIDADDDDEDEI